MITSVREPQGLALASVGQFHSLFGVPIEPNPCLPDEKRSELRVALLQEELDELKEAIAKNDLIEVADALADLQYVLSGTVHEFGMGSRFASLFDEVHRSNMSKACATRDEAEATVAHYAARNQPAQIFEQPDGSFLVKRIADDKVLKSVNYSEPRLNVSCTADLPRPPPTARERDGSTKAYFSLSRRSRTSTHTHL